jgi:hypothetical protein
LLLKPKKLTKIVRRPEKPLPFFRKTSTLPSEKFVEQHLPLKDSQRNGDIFKGEAINLDVVFSNLDHITPPK